MLSTTTSGSLVPPVSPQEFREQVRSHTDIVGLIGESIGLQPRSGGREYVGLCCFHPDNNPSLRVYPDKQSFRCWSCSTGGDCFTFVMERENVTFPEAVEILARRANLEVPKFISGKTPEQESTRTKLLEALAWAESQFHDTLVNSPAGQAAREYLNERGVSQEMIRKFRLGFHPDNRSWLLDRAKGKFPPKLLVEASLAGQKEWGYYDNFVNRVMFPIHNERGQAVSFGGRILPGSSDPKKYWNGLESPVFHKSRLVYAIDKSREAIRDTDCVLVVEGYTDCIACHQFGVGNVVATLGTALTDSHVTVLKRFARKVILVFDGDDAGQGAASRAVERFLAQDVDLRILTLPGKTDPAEFLELQGAEEFNKLAEKAPEAWEFRFQAARKKFGTDTIDGRQRVLEEMLEVLACVPAIASSVREPMLVANLAHRLGVAEAKVLEQLREIRHRQKSTPQTAITKSEQPQPDQGVKKILDGKISANERLECDLLEIILAAPQSLHFITGSGLETTFRNSVLSHLMHSCLVEFHSTGELTLTGLINRMPTPELKSLIVWFDEQASAKDLANRLREDDQEDSGCPELLQRILNAFRQRDIKQSHQDVSIKISEASGGQSGFDDATLQLLKQKQELLKTQHETRKAGAQRPA